MQENRFLNKRGISPLIATVLIIGFTVALGAVIMTWGSGFVKNMQEQTQLSAEESQIFAETQIDIESVTQPHFDLVTFSLENTGQHDVENLLIRIEGTQDTQSFTKTGLNIADKKHYKLQIDPATIGDVKNIEIIPVVSIQGKDVTGRTGTTRTPTKLEDTLQEGSILWTYLDQQENGEILDLSGNENHVTLIGGTTDPTYLEEGAVRGGAYYFDGVDNRLVIYDQNSLDVDSITISAWVNVSDIAGDMTIISKRFRFDLQNSWEIRVKYSSNTYYAYWLEGDPDDGGYTLPPPDINGAELPNCIIPKETWTHLTITKTGGTVNCYINGNLKDTASLRNGLYSSTTNILLGATNSGAPALFFKGALDEILIHNRSLTTGEIKKLYERGN